MATEATAAAAAAANAVNVMTHYLQWQNALSQVPMFDGKESELRSFVLDVEQAFVSLGEGANEVEFVKRILPKLCGRARECIEGQTFADLKSLVKRLKESFTAVGLTFAHYHSQLSQLKMSTNESVSEFASRIRKLISKAKAAISHEFGEATINTYTPIVTAAALNGFLRGLRPDLEIRVAIRKPSNLEAAIEVARDEECRAIDRYPSHNDLTGFFPRPFPPPRFPMVSRPPISGFSQRNSQNPGRFDPRMPNHWPARPTHFRDNEINRPFMKPRNPHHSQPPTPRYADRENVRAVHYAEAYQSTEDYAEPYNLYQQYYPAGYENFGGHEYEQMYGNPYSGVYFGDPNPHIMPHRGYSHPKEGKNCVNNNNNY